VYIVYRIVCRKGEVKYPKLIEPVMHRV